MPDGRSLPVSARKARLNKALDMRAKLIPYSKIAEECGYPSVQAACKDVNKALIQHFNEVLPTVRERELYSLDIAEAKLWEILDRFHYVKGEKGMVMYSPDGEPLRDSAPEMAAIERIVKIHERRARLLGIDAPEKIDHRVAVIQVRT
jgi:hypothetical protein